MEQGVAGMGSMHRVKKNFLKSPDCGIFLPGHTLPHPGRTKRKKAMNRQEKNSRLWEAVISDMHRHSSIGEYGFDAFISKLSLRCDTGSKLVLEYPSDLAIDWVEINYLVDIQDSVNRVLDAGRHIEFVSEGSEDPEGYGQEMREAPVPVAAKSEKNAKKKPIRTAKNRLNSGLNEDFTFDGFVVGPNSDFAYSAARSVASDPSNLHNPLVISGGSGMGKTHLMQAIGNAIRERDDETQVLYVTSEDFTNAYIEAVSRRGEGLNSFRRKYRRADVLLIDDVQFIATKDRTQEEFFHTFNALLSSGKQIVLTTDCPPSQITGLDARLTSRFEQGLNVVLNPPPLETRIAILCNKRRQWRSDLISDELLRFLAEHITCSVRRLEGSLIKMSTYATFSHRKPTIADARQCLKDILAQERAEKSLSIDVIQAAVAREFNVRVADINGRRRTANIAYPRQIAMYLARQYTDFSLTEIGEAFGGRDHGTVIHAGKTVEEKMKRDPKLKEQLSRMVLTL